MYPAVHVPESATGRCAGYLRIDRRHLKTRRSNAQTSDRESYEGERRWRARWDSNPRLPD